MRCINGSHFSEPPHSSPCSITAVSYTTNVCIYK
nr:MAG TPA: hypothetical protein [Caudoviricetes sp.]